MQGKLVSTFKNKEQLICFRLYMEKVQQVHKRRETENYRWITIYYVKELQKSNQKEFRVEKVIKRK